MVAVSCARKAFGLGSLSLRVDTVRGDDRGRHTIRTKIITEIRGANFIVSN